MYKKRIYLDRDVSGQGNLGIRLENREEKF